MVAMSRDVKDFINNNHYHYLTIIITKTGQYYFKLIDITWG